LKEIADAIEVLTRPCGSVREAGAVFTKDDAGGGGADGGGAGEYEPRCGGVLRGAGGGQSDNVTR